MSSARLGIFWSGATSWYFRVCKGAMMGCAVPISRILDAPSPISVICHCAGAALGESQERLRLTGYGTAYV